MSAKTKSHKFPLGTLVMSKINKKFMYRVTKHTACNGSPTYSIVPEIDLGDTHNRTCVGITYKQVSERTLVDVKKLRSNTAASVAAVVANTNIVAIADVDEHENVRQVTYNVGTRKYSVYLNGECVASGLNARQAASEYDELELVE